MEQAGAATAAGSDVFLRGAETKLGLSGRIAGSLDDHTRLRAPVARGSDDSCVIRALQAYDGALHMVAVTIAVRAF